MRRIAVIAAASALLAAAPAQARPGDLDRSFGKGGRLGLNLYPTGGTPTSLTLIDGVRPLMSISLYDRSGPEPTWLQLTGLGRVGSSVTMQPTLYRTMTANGFALSQLPFIKPQEEYVLSRPGSTQGVTLTLPGRGFAANGFGVDAAGRVVVIAADYRRQNKANAVAMRFLATGALDTAYGTNGVAHLKSQNPNAALLVRSDGRVYVSDGFSTVALDARGKRVRGFGRLHLPKRGVYPDAAMLTAGPRGTVVIAVRSEDGSYVVRLRADGRRDQRFGRRGIVAGIPALSRINLFAVARDRRGRLVLGGSTYFGAADEFRAAVIRLSTRGRADRSFATQGRKVFQLADVPGVNVYSSGVRHVAIDRRGRIVVAGASYDDDFGIREDTGQPWPAIARLQG